MLLRGYKVIDGNRFLGMIENTDYWDMFSDPAPDGYTATLDLNDMKKIVEDIDSKELRELYRYMQSRAYATYILVF